MIHKLLHQQTNAEIKIGDTVKTFRGEEFKLTDFRPGHHSGSTGRVYLADEDGNTHEYYPGVINARIVVISDETGKQQ